MGKAFFDQVELPVRARKHGHFRKGAHAALFGRGAQHVHTAGEAGNLLGDPHRLGKGRVRTGKAHRRALRRCGAQRTRRAGVVRYAGHGAAKNVRRRTVVNRKRHGFQFRKVGAQALKTACIRAAEAVNGLVRIANDKQAFPCRAPVAHESALRGVDVLEFVHQHVGKAPVGRNVRLERVQQKVVQIARAQLPQASLIRLDQRLAHARRGAGFAVFDLGNRPQSGAGTHFPQFRQAVKRLQRAILAQKRLVIQQAQAKGMKRANMKRLCRARAQTGL